MIEQVNSAICRLGQFLLTADGRGRITVFLLQFPYFLNLLVTISLYTARAALGIGKV